MVVNIASTEGKRRARVDTVVNASSVGNLERGSGAMNAKIVVGNSGVIGASRDFELADKVFPESVAPEGREVRSFAIGVCADEDPDTFACFDQIGKSAINTDVNDQRGDCFFGGNMIEEILVVSREDIVTGRSTLHQRESLRNSFAVSNRLPFGPFVSNDSVSKVHRVST